MKKVLHLAQFLKYGSSTGIVALITQLKKQGIQSELLLSYPVHGQDHSMALIESLLLEGIKITYVDSTFVRNSWNLQSIQNKVQRNFPKQDYHYITHGGFAALALSRIDYDFVHVCHGFGMNRPPHINVQDFEGISRAKKVYAVSKDIIHQLSDLGLDSKKIQLMYYPLNIQRIHFPKARKIKKLGIVGNLISRKGQIFAIKALEALSSEYPEISLSIFGDGEDESSLKLYVSENMLDNKVFFKGFCAVANIFDQIDLLLVPSLSEGLGMVNLEAFLYGVPVVAFDSGGISEIIKDHQSGLLAKRKSSLDLSQKVKTYLRDYKMAFRHCKEGFFIAEKLFDPAKNMTSILYVLKK
ncbi:glycosyltransferase family 4 protein [bacterium]|nr:glycosyltransferase family 4 protein [bacterium]